MANPVYGVWDGQVLDDRRAPPDEPRNILIGLGDFAPDNTVKAFIADRGFLVFDPNTSLAEAFRQYLAHATAQSCGRCTPCRVGTRRMRDLLTAFAGGRADSDTLDEINEIAGQVSATSLCGLGQTCATSLIAALAHFRADFRPLSPAQAVFQHSFVYTTAPCIEACPSRIDVPKYIDGVKGGKFDFALGVILDKYSMAATCGRVCVRFCETACRRTGADGAVGIRTLKRYAADQAIKNGRLRFTRPAVQHPERVAVVGAGPAGITCAYKLLLAGIQVDIYDAQRTSGGMAAIGIPSYRLPKDVIKTESEDVVRDLGGQFFYGKVLGRDFSVNQLMSNGYDAVFLGYGASLGTTLGIRNEERKPRGYTSGVDFLLDIHNFVEYGEAFEVKGDVVVVGGGNVAMDCVRSARRMGARSVHLIYRRTREDMPAEHEEIIAAEAEGIIFHFLTNPSGLVIEKGKLVGIDLVQMRQTELDSRGRRSVTPIAGSESFMPCDLMVAAIGQQIDKDVLRHDEGIRLDRWNCVVVNPETLETSRPGVFAGGDCVIGPLTLVNALEHGERAAASIRDYLDSGEISVKPAYRMQRLLENNRLLASECIRTQPIHRAPAKTPERPANERIADFAEVEGPISKEAAYEEASRCLRCYRSYSVVTERPLVKADEHQETGNGHSRARKPTAMAEKMQ